MSKNYFKKIANKKINEIFLQTYFSDRACDEIKEALLRKFDNQFYIEELKIMSKLTDDSIENLINDDVLCYIRRVASDELGFII